jgi:signal transduction histidine kinase
MIVGDQMLGVFDLQSDVTGRFAEEDQKVLTALAEQITIAVRNAQLFSDMQTAQQQAEQANTVKSRFLAAMSHELRTPLNAILNFTQFVLSGVMGPVNQRQQDALQKVTTSGEHLLDLINDVLDITKIEAGSMQLFLENDVSINEYLEMAVSTAKSMLADKPVSLNVDISDNLPVIRGDKLRIRQIMLNLVSNACKFTDTGSVTIRACRKDGNILFSVKDTGPGIAPEEQYHIFEAFQQTQLGLKKGGGTGLGLAISRRLAEAHGGTLWFESTLGQGTTFYVALPISGQIPVTGE